MMYRVLGKLAIGTPANQLSLPRGHRLTVLAVLLVNVNRPVSTRDLLRVAWGDPDVDETQLHKGISQLRTLLATVDRRGDLRTHAGYGYELRAAESEVDLLVFDRLIRDADAAAKDDRPDDQVAALRAALQLWRGQHPLEGVPTEAVRLEVTDLGQRRKRAAVRLFDLEIARSGHERILAELTTMAGYHPTDRRLCEQLMVALYRSGHATEAVTAFDRYAGALAEETGAEPEASLRDLAYAIGSSDEQAVGRYTQIGGAPSATSVVPVVLPRQLPPAPADFVGRGDLIAEAQWLLTRDPGTAPPVVVVTGAGGMGKTAVTRQIAHQVRGHYPDGQLYVELRGTTAHPTETSEVLAQLLRAFGLENVPATLEERVALYRSVVGDRRILLVIDDARDEAHVRDLIPGNPGCGVLVNGRNRLLNLDGAHHVPTLRALQTPDAVALFQSIVRRAGVDPTAEPEATKQVVGLCAGLPLALCIAAALRCGDDGRTTTDLAERLARQRLDAFVHSDRSVARSIGAGFDRLDADSRLLFLSLGVLELTDFGSWTAAAVLGEDAGDPDGALARLAGGSMVQPTGPGRYRFHELTQQYARGRAAGTNPVADRDLLLRQAYGALLTLVRHAHRGIYGGDFEVVHSQTPAWNAPAGVLAEIDRDPLAWYELERLNIRAAVRHSAEAGLAALCWDLAVSAHEFYTIRGYLDDWHATHLIALQACRTSADERGEAAILAALGQPALTASQRPDVSGEAELTRAVDLFHSQGDGHGEAIALRTLGNCLRRQGSLDEALGLFDRALTGYQASGDTVGRWQTLRFVGQTHLDLGNLTEALQVMNQAAAVAEQIGAGRLIAQTAYWLGNVHLAMSDLAAAKERFSYVLGLVGDSDVTGRGYAVFGLAEVARLAGDHTDARRYLADATDLARTAHDTVLEGRVYRSLASVYHAQGRACDEVAALERAASCFAGGRAPYLEAQALSALSALAS